MSTGRPAQSGLHPGHGLRHNLMADGTRVLSGHKRIRPGARSTVLLWPGLFRLDVTSNEDSQSLVLRALAGHRVEGGPAHARTRTVISTTGEFEKLTEFEFELVGSGYDPVQVVLAMPGLSVGWDELGCGASAVLPANWPQRT
jgi:hypothetical protein